MATTKRKNTVDTAARTRAAVTRKPTHARKPANIQPRALVLAVATAFLPWFLAQAVYGQTPPPAPAPNTLPVLQLKPGGGDGKVHEAQGTNLLIEQFSTRMILEGSFTVGSLGHVRLDQKAGPSAVALVNDNSGMGSRIFGTVIANGQLFISNGYGVYFAPGARVEAAGLIATTLKIADQDFMSGIYNWYRDGAAGSVWNQGEIITANGYTALIGPDVRNDGVIAARMGSVVLAAGDRVSLDLIGDGLISVSVDQAAYNASVIHTGTIEAEGGTVLLSARSANALLDTVINSSGVIRANSLVERNGEIVLDGGSAGVVSVTGTLQAAGVGAGTTGGTIKVLGDDLRLMAGTRLDASGMGSGGTVLVGGNFQGAGPEANASRTYVDPNATLRADAVGSGNGGKVIVWADRETYFFGHISARGGADSGDGGFVEVSGKDFLAFRGTADRLAPNGRAGTLLLDPTDMTITAAVGDIVCLAGSCTSSNNTSTLQTTVLAAALLGGAVNVDATAGGGTGGGTINWTDGLVDAGGNSLTLTGNSITFDGTLTNLNNLVFSTAPSGSGSATSSAGGSITGISSLTFALSAANTGTAAGITFTGFNAADSTTITGASGFDDAAKSSLGMTFSGATNVSGTGTISNVAGSFDDATLVSTASGIDYAGFTAVTGTGTALTGVNVSFDDTTKVSGSGVDYSGLASLATVAGDGTTDVTGTTSFAIGGANTGTGASGIVYSSIDSVSSATTLTGASGFDDTALTSQGIAFAAATNVTGTGTISNVGGNFDDATLVSTASGIDYAGFTAVTGTGTALTGVNVSFDDTTKVSGSGVDYSGLASLATVAGDGTTDVTGTTSFAIGGANTGTGASGIVYSSIDSVSSATTLTGASGFDDTALTSQGIAFAAATNVTGTGTISNVGGNFDDATLVSTASGIDYAGFTAVTGTATVLTGVNVSFDDTAKVSGSGVDYSGFAVATVSGTATVLTGVDISFDDTTQVSGSGINYSGLGSLATVSGNATSLTGVATSFNDSTQVSGNGIDYSGLTSLATVAGDGTTDVTGTASFAIGGANTGTGASGIVYSSIDSVSSATTVTGASSFDDTALTSQGIAFAAATNVTGTGTISNVGGNFDDATLVSTASGIDYAGFTAVTGTGTTVTGVAGSFNDTTKVSTASGVDYSGFAVITVTGTGGDVTAVAGNFSLNTRISAASSIDYSGFNLGTVAGTGGGTITGTGQTYALANGTPDAGTSGTLSWTNFPNISDATGTVIFQNSGSVTGDITAQTFNYGTYGAPVTFNLAGTGITGIGGTVTGVTSVTGSGNSDMITGSTQTYNLTGANQGNNGTVNWTSFENLTDTAAGTFNFIGTGSVATITGGAGTDTINISGMGGGETVTLTGTGAGSIAGIVTTGFTSISTFTGSGSDSLQLDNSANTATINAANAGSLASGETFSGFNTLLAGGGGDSFVFTGSGTLATVTGGAGTDTININAMGGGKTVTLTGTEAGSIATVVTTGFTQIENFVGSGGESLQLDNSANTVTINAANAGSLASGETFSGFNTVLAGSGGDTFAITTGSIATVTGGAGTDTLDLSGKAGLLSINASAGTASSVGAFTSIESVIGNDGITTTNTTLTGATFSLTGANSGTANGIAYSGVGNLAGVVGANSFTGVAGGDVDGTITDGGVTTTLSGSITSGGAQSYSGAVTLGAATVLDSNGSSVSLTNTVNGAFALQVDAATTASLTGGAGGSTPLTQLVVTAPSMTLGNVTTNGLQDYNGNVTFTSSYNTNGGSFDVSGNTTLNSDSSINTGAGAVNFGGTINSQADENNSLTINGGTIIFVGNIGTTNALSSLSTTGTTTFSTAGTQVNTTTGQTYNGATSGNNLVLTGGNITATNGANDFTGTLDVTASSASITDMNALTIDATLTGGLTTNSGALTYVAGLSVASLDSNASGAVNQTGAITVTGATNVNAGGNAITLTSANDFQGAVSLTGGTTQITDANALTLGTVNVGALTTVNTGALDLGTLIASSLDATTNGGNIMQSGTATITGTTNLQAGSGSIVLANTSNDFGGMITGGATGGINLADANDMTFGPLGGGTALVRLTAAGDIFGPGFVSGGTGIFSSSGGADTQVTNLGITFSSNVTVTGSATFWNFSAGSSAGSFSRTDPNIGVAIGGATFLANLVQIRAGNVISSVAGAAAAVIVDEANKTFGTDSVAEDVEYGFAGEIGTTPPMDHRIDETGISTPQCMIESREGVPCK